VIPKAVSKRIQEVSPFTPEHGAPMPPSPTAVRFHTNRIIDMVVNAACTDCNSVFFNALQSACEPELSVAIGGDGVAMDTDKKRALCAWAYKTALLIPLSMAARSSWPAHVLAACSSFHRDRRPPIGAGVWTANYDVRDNFPDLVTRCDVSELRFRRRGQDYEGTQVLFTLAYLVLIVVFWHGDAPDHFDLNSGPAPAESMERLWPVRVGIFRWPPTKRLTYAELSSLGTWQSP
jgi:hypothetical protein